MDTPQRRSRLPLIAGIVVVLVAVAVGAFLYATRDTSDPELQIAETDEGTGEAVDTGSLDGSWTVVPGEGENLTEAGYRVREVFAAGSREATANGRTKDVTGTLTVAGGAVTEGSFTVDVTTLQSDEGRRDNAIKDRGLQTNEFPEATFALTEPVPLPELADGEAFEVEVTGELTLHGVTNPVTIPLEGLVSGDTITVQGSAPVVMADYEIEPPSVGGFVEVEDEGSFEFLVNFQQA
ncbi:MAG TPA: YceI family protein [Aquihabitans sp.]|jgi:polyisoprenoid-binding protein YceI|nr:YceI family protein [Aquihabitans sp.]